MPILESVVSVPLSPVLWLKEIERSLAAISLTSLSSARVDRETLPDESVELEVREAIVDWARL